MFDRKKYMKEYHKKWYLKNKKEVIKRARKWAKQNPKKRKIIFTRWVENNYEQHRLSGLRWRNKNRKLISKKNIAYAIKKYKTDPSFKLKACLRSRVICVLKGRIKSVPTLKLLGVSNIEKVWKHLEKQFKQGMTRENHGKWHIDHIKPCISFDLTKPEEQAKCFHYTNLQPLWASENLAKGSKISY
jgi:hypothetical protein